MTIQNERSADLTGLKISAGQRTITGQKYLLPDHFNCSPVFWTDHIFTTSAEIKYQRGDRKTSNTAAFFV